MTAFAIRFAVTGTQGQVARSLAERGTLSGHDIRLVGRPDIDLENPESIRSALADIQADVVVNAAAYTGVDKAESEPERAMRVNSTGAKAVASAAASLGLPVIHLSTDYVFDGALDRPYRESDPTGPLGAYGRSKLAGEAAVAAVNPAHVILRTAWVYSPFGLNFLKTMLRLGETRGEVGVVADQYGAPTSALDIADAILTIARTVYDRRDDARLTGTFHLTGSGEASWADFAESIFAAATDHGRPPVSVRRIATTDYPTPAPRPKNSRLDTQKLAQAYGVVLPDWRLSTRVCVARLLSPFAS